MFNIAHWCYFHTVFEVINRGDIVLNTPPYSSQMETLTYHQGQNHMLTKTRCCFLQTPLMLPCVNEAHKALLTAELWITLCMIKMLTLIIHKPLFCEYGFLLLNCIIVSRVTVQCVLVWLQTQCKKAQQESKFFFSFSVLVRKCEEGVRFSFCGSSGRRKSLVSVSGLKGKEGRRRRESEEDQTVRAVLVD